jgi:hypothetical protein
MSCARILKGTLALLALVGCSLVVETQDLDKGCPTGQRLCEGACVSNTDPAYGCTPGVCGPPCTQPNGIPHCVDGLCALKVCRYGFGCPGCDVDILTNEERCGDCDTRCMGSDRCVNGLCTPQPTTTRAPSASKR